MNLNQILQVVSQATNQHEDNIKSHSRIRDYSDARKMFSYACYQFTENGQADIGEFLNMDHSTIQNHIQTVRNIIDTEKDKSAMWDKIKHDLTVLGYRIERTDMRIFKNYNDSDIAERKIKRYKKTA